MSSNISTKYNYILSAQKLKSDDIKDKIEGVNALRSLYDKDFNVLCKIIEFYKKELIGMFRSENYDQIILVLELIELFCSNKDTWITTFYSFMFFDSCSVLSFYLNEKPSYKSQLVINKVKSGFLQLQEYCQLGDSIIELLSVSIYFTDNPDVFSMLITSILKLTENLSQCFIYDNTFYDSLYKNIVDVTLQNEKLKPLCIDILQIILRTERNFNLTFTNCEKETIDGILSLLELSKINQ